MRCAAEIVFPGRSRLASLSISPRRRVAAPGPTHFPLQRSVTLRQPDPIALALFEDEILLGPPHTAHDLIREEGGGAYSHWGDTLYFSTTDATDPRVNGRPYRAVIPP